MHKPKSKSCKPRHRRAWRERNLYSSQGRHILWFSTESESLLTPSEWYSTLTAIHIGYGLLMAVRLLKRNALQFKSAGGFEIAV